jgi:hypothetical protein
MSCTWSGAPVMSAPVSMLWSMSRRKQVYKITYPNGKIYVGMAPRGAVGVHRDSDTEF